MRLDHLLSRERARAETLERTARSNGEEVERRNCRKEEEEEVRRYRERIRERMRERIDRDFSKLYRFQGSKET